MGRPKGGTNRRWSAEDKLKLVQEYQTSNMGVRAFAKQMGISDGMFREWVKRYCNNGIDGLQNKKKTGNPFAALATSKSLTEEERLRLIIAKQEVEIERLKKGYLVKGVGVKKEYVTTKDANTK